MTALLTAIATVWGAWVVVGGACLGWGAWLWSRLPGLAPRAKGPAALFWTGFCVLIGLLQIWHLFLPVDRIATIGLLGGGWLALGLIRPLRSGFFPPLGVAGVAVLLVLAFWLAFRALDFPRNYDSGLYHFAMVRWICEYPEVPGLANLHDRLGFNQSYFLFIALMNAHPFTNEGYHVANSLLCFALLAQLLGTTCCLLRQSGAARPAQLVQAFLLPVIIGQALGGDISSPTPDLAVFAIGVAVFLFAIHALEHEPAAAPVAFLLLVTGCTIKLSFAAFGLAVIALLWLAVRAERSPATGQGTTPPKLLPLVLLTGGAWGIPYVIRGIILSGYPAFPLVMLPAPVDWRLPAVEAHAAADAILSWGRIPGAATAETLHTWAWFRPWLDRTLANPEVVTAIFISGGAILAIAGATLLPRSIRADTRKNLLPLIPLGVGLAAWFFTAPDVRFANWLLWLLATWLLAWAVSLLPAWLPAIKPRVLAAVGLGATGFVLALSYPSWLLPGAYGLHSSPRVHTQVFVTRSGLSVNIPAEGADSRLADSPLPSSTHGKPDLELRGTSLRAGFRTAGTSQP